MALDLEWRHRIDAWRNELKRHFYISLGSVELEAYMTKDMLELNELDGKPFHPVKPGEEWGEMWEYGWFKGRVILPAEAEGKRIVLCVDVGAESAIYVNGKNVGAKDEQHKEILLTKNGKAGQKYEIIIEAYAGHGPRVCGTGPVPPGRETVPIPPGKQAVVGETTFGIWQEDVYQLWMDVETLYGVRENIDKDSLRVAEIDRGLKDFTIIVDFELPRDEMLATVKKCRERLKPLLECVNGSTVPEMFVFGHSHIDVAWLWPLAETIRKCARTFSTQLALMEEYPEYKFVQSQPHLYKMVKKHYPELYKRIKKAVAEGNFIPEGGMWVEADTNVTSGESLIRQFIFGKRFFEEEFGVKCELLWLPDVFGYSGALPQIIKGCGIKYFSTQKIFWIYNGGDPFPYNTFTWEGIDGTAIFAHFHEDYNSHTNPATIIKRWNNRVQKEGFSKRLFPFGYGDGGGGPTRDHLEYLRRMENLEGVPKTRMCHPLEFFREQEREGLPEARYIGELYFQNHRGTYTSQARTKKGNRKSELTLREAELWSAVAMRMKAFDIPAADLMELWENVLLNQFHDIIPGSSIARVYEEAEADYVRIIKEASQISDSAVSTFIEEDGGVTVFNSLSWDRKELIALPEGFAGASCASTGKSLPSQKIGDITYVEAETPSCGWISLKPASPMDIGNSITVTERMLENECIRIELNEKGEITSLFDKDSNTELAGGLCNSFKMYKDVPSLHDAWDIDSTYALCPVELDEKAQFEILAQGPLMGSLKVRRKLNNSLMTQEISIRRGSRVVEFKTCIDWQERHKLLKVNFPVNIYTDELVSEIQFGHIKRPNHKSRQFDADRFEVSNHKWSALIEAGRGFAVLNDCKYGVNAVANSINLTLLKSAMAPDMNADKGLHEFTYAIYFWNGSFMESDVIRKAYELNCPVKVVSGTAPSASIFKVDNSNVIIETVKPAEDGSKDVILRMYESKRTAACCTLYTSLPFSEAVEADMLENEVSKLAYDGERIELKFRPFEIKTIRLKR